MNTTSTIYLIIFIIVIFFISSNVGNSLKYKKENMKELLHLNEDDKKMRLISSLLMVFMLISSVILITGMIKSNNYGFEQILTMVVLPVLMIVLYLPLSKKTKVSTIGIHKRSYLIRWEAIKGFNYLKPNEKNLVKVKILYNNASKDAYAELTFSKDDNQLDKFKEIAKEYRNIKKKDKKIGK